MQGCGVVVPFPQGGAHTAPGPAPRTCSMSHCAALAHALPARLAAAAAPTAGAGARAPQPRRGAQASARLPAAQLRLPGSAAARRSMVVVKATEDEPVVDTVDAAVDPKQAKAIEDLIKQYGPAIQGFAPAGTYTVPVARDSVDATPATLEEEESAGPYRFLARALGAAAVGAAGVALYKKLKEEKPEAAEILDEPIGGTSFVTVRPGDTLGLIAKEFGTTVDVLKEANNIRDANSIQVGQELWVPRTYVIKKGDTLSKLARENGTTVADLVKKNHVRNPDLIFAGDILLLP